MKIIKMFIVLFCFFILVGCNNSISGCDCYSRECYEKDQTEEHVSGSNTPTPNDYHVSGATTN